MSYLAKNYNRKKISFKFGKGSYLFSTDKKKYLDFVQGIAVNSLGHSHPKLIKALQDQVGTLWHTSNLYHIPQQTALAELLCKTSFADLVFFGNSGAEAVEGCIKLARKYQSAIGHPEKWRVIACSGSFHGRSFATLSASKMTTSAAIPSSSVPRSVIPQSFATSPVMR